MYPVDHDLDEDNGMKHVLAYVQNQLSFDLRYIFLGIFCICISESARLMDDSDPVRLTNHFNPFKPKNSYMSRNFPFSQSSSEWPLNSKSTHKCPELACIQY